MPLFIFWIIFLLDLELNFVGKQLVFRWELIVLLLLQRFHGLSYGKIRLALFRLSIQLQPDDLLNIDNIYLDQMVDRTPIE